MRRNLGALVLAAVFVLSSLAGIAMGADNFENGTTNVDLKPSNYPTGVPDRWYAPGDSIEIEVTMDDTTTADGANDVVDLIAYTWPGDPCTDEVWREDDLLLDADGMASAVIDGSTTAVLSDGNYEVLAGAEDYLETSCGTNVWDVEWFVIQMYTIDADTDRDAYIPGDTVTVFYTVSQIKDGSLVTDTAFSGEWSVESSDGATSDTGSFDQPSGTFAFTITNTGGISPGDWYTIRIWYNGTKSGAQRTDSWSDNPWVNDISINWVEAPLADYPLGSIVRIRVRIVVTGSGGDPAPGADVDVEVQDGTGASASAISGYGGSFTADENGEVFYAFILDSADFDEDQSYTVHVEAKKVLKTDEDDQIFAVVPPVEVISVRMDFDKGVYTSGDTASVTANAAAPAGRSAPNSFIFEVRAGSTLYAREAGSSNTFTFNIPIEFEGGLTFRVDVYNADGDYGFDQQTRQVVFGVMLVNADSDRYNPGESITVDYELVSSLMDAPDIFYQVSDSGGSTVLEGSQQGTSQTGSFSYGVPDPASNWYTFTVFAAQDGREVQGTDTSMLIQFFVLHIGFDKPVYAPGDTMVVSYSVKARGDSDLPNSYRLSYGLDVMVMDSTATAEASGSVTYVIPTDTNQGDVFFTMTEGNTGTVAIEMVTVQAGANPLWWTQMADIPLFDIILLILIVILFILLFRMGGRRAAAPGGGPMGPEAEEPPPPDEPVMGTSMTVSCKSCGAPIEITTSKRPIEVMCPSCGETEMVV